jgi:hypothetical protein
VRGVHLQQDTVRGATLSRRTNQLQSVGYSEQRFRSMQRPPLHCFPGHKIVVASILSVEVVLHFHSCILELLGTQMKLHADLLCSMQCTPQPPKQHSMCSLLSRAVM